MINATGINKAVGTAIQRWIWRNHIFKDLFIFLTDTMLITILESISKLMDSRSFYAQKAQYIFIKLAFAFFDQQILEGGNEQDYQQAQG